MPQQHPITDRFANKEIENLWRQSKRARQDITIIERQLAQPMTAGDATYVIATLGNTDWYEFWFVPQCTPFGHAEFPTDPAGATWAGFPVCSASGTIMVLEVFCHVKVGIPETDGAGWIALGTSGDSVSLLGDHMVRFVQLMTLSASPRDEETDGHIITPVAGDLMWHVTTETVWLWYSYVWAPQFPSPTSFPRIHVLVRYADVLPEPEWAPADPTIPGETLPPGMPPTESE